MVLSLLQNYDDYSDDTFDDTLWMILYDNYYV
jgi:hypothetical protein